VEILNVRRAVLNAVMIATLATGMALPAGQDLEDQVKAAFLFNFLKFVEWPGTSTDASWEICVLGREPVGDALDNTIRGKLVNGRPVEVRRYAKPGDLKGCHILFLGHAESERAGAPSQPGLLTVGEAPGFLKSGGIINFYLEQNRVHFEISASAAHSSGLRVSPQLLRLGRAL
jgi:hypothetical protein